MNLFHRIAKLPWLPRITLILFVIVLTNWIMMSTTGYSLLGGDLFTVFFIVFLVLLSLALIPPLMRKVLWRVRNRLLVTYFLVGAVPVLLMLLIGTIGFYAFTGVSSGYIAQAELNHRIDQLESSARQLAQDIQAGRRSVSVEGLPWQAVLRVGDRTIKTGRLREIPSWSRPGVKGIVRAADNVYFLAAHAESDPGPNHVEVFAFSTFDNQAVAKLIPGVARVRIFRVHDFASLEDVDINVSPALDSAKADPAMNFDFGAMSGMPIVVRELETGKNEDHAISLTARPSFYLNRVLSPLGFLASPAVVSIEVIAGVLLAVELIAALSSVRLTRTLTRAMHDLYIGTKKIERGEFSHRIPVRTKDQINELATSFNSMTERVEHLIIEVKEKEKLQAELEIARQVQAQLFPKHIPKLKTLELFGACTPARIVSGDYYDFIPLGSDSQSTAVVIGDISGKGISAALLMASLQSSLHAQLTMSMNGNVSTATLVRQLNRQLYENTPPEKYATFYCGIYDDTNGRLLYTNAGHLAPILLRRNDIIRLESNGMVVGMFPDSCYEQSSVELQPGDLLTAFTDGITESENERGEQFGEARLTDLLLRNNERPLDEIVRLVTEAVRNWASDLDDQDDTTILLARRF